MSIQLFHATMTTIARSLFSRYPHCEITFVHLILLALVAPDHPLVSTHKANMQGADAVASTGKAVILWMSHASTEAIIFLWLAFIIIISVLSRATSNLSFARFVYAFGG
jgi:hypothetical protein